MAGIDYSSLPMGANPETDQIVGYTEFGEPIRRARFGGAEYSIEQVATGKQGSTVKEAIKHPLDTVGYVASGVAGSIWNGLQTPGRAARGETITNGDLTDTLGLAAVGPVGGTAPQGALRSGLSRTETSQQILDMLKGGKAADITDDMLSAADAQYLYQNYDLPMDAASRMQRAQEMGFDTGRPVYHGTPDGRAVSQGGFDASSQQVHRGGGNFETIAKPIFTTDNRGVAQTYANPHRAFDYQAAEPNIFELYRKTGDDAIIDGAGERFKGLPADKISDQLGINLDAYPTQIRDGRVSTDGLSVMLADKGMDGAIIKRVVDDYMGKGKPSEVQMTFDPTRLRSANARFDPRLKHLSNLSAGVAGAGVFGSTEDNKAQIRAWLEGSK